MGILETMPFRDSEEALILYDIGLMCEPGPGIESNDRDGLAESGRFSAIHIRSDRIGDGNRPHVESRR